MVVGFWFFRLMRLLWCSFTQNHGLEQQLSFSLLVNFSTFQPFPLAKRSERGERSRLLSRNITFSLLVNFSIFKPSLPFIIRYSLPDKYLVMKNIYLRSTA